MTALPQAGALVFRDDGRFLALVGGVGAWSVPKGAIELGEAPVATAEREILEETGVICECVSYLMRFPFTRQDNDYELRLYTARWIDGEARDYAHENTKACWLDPGTALSMPTSDPHYLEALKLAVALDRPACAVLPPEADVELLDALLGEPSHLVPMSSGMAKRPLYRIGETGVAARLHESAEEACRAATVLRMLESVNCPRLVKREGRWLVTSYLDGKVLGPAPLSEGCARDAGRLLGAIHSSRIEPLSLRTEAMTDARNYVRETTTRSARLVEGAGLLSAEQTTRVERTLAKWEPGAIVPTHWDFVPGNLLETDRGVAAIDFEGARLFFDGFDQAKAMFYLVTSASQREAFSRGYAESAPLGSAWPDQEMTLFFLLRVLANRVNRPHLDFRSVRRALAREIA